MFPSKNSITALLLCRAERLRGFDRWNVYKNGLNFGLISKVYSTTMIRRVGIPVITRYYSEWREAGSSGVIITFPGAGIAQCGSPMDSARAEPPLPSGWLWGVARGMLRPEPPISRGRGRQRCSCCFRAAAIPIDPRPPRLWTGPPKGGLKARSRRRR